MSNQRRELNAPPSLERMLGEATYKGAMLKAMCTEQWDIVRYFLAYFRTSGVRTYDSPLDPLSMADVIALAKEDFQFGIVSPRAALVNAMHAGHKQNAVRRLVRYIRMHHLEDEVDHHVLGKAEGMIDSSASRH